MVCGIWISDITVEINRQQELTDKHVFNNIKLYYYCTVSIWDEIISVQRHRKRRRLSSLGFEKLVQCRMLFD